MQYHTLCAVTLVCVLVALCKASDDTRPLYEADQVFGPELAERGEREKKAIDVKLAAGFGVKNFLLNLVFGKVNQVIDFKTGILKKLERTNRYKNYYLLGLGTAPKGAAPGGGSGQVGAGASEPRAEAGLLTNAGGLGSAFGAITGLLGGLQGNAAAN